MNLSLIGMSGSGKSTWSVKLAGAGFRRYCDDDRIARKLASELERPGEHPMELGEWMGFPDEDHYAVRESRYLDCEIAVMAEILQILENSEAQMDIVIDTTGSAIYTGEAMLQRLRRCSTIVHLSTPPEVQEKMLKAYLANQRPLLWQGLFKKDPEETRNHAMARCYRLLLKTRERLYRKYADVTLDYFIRNRPGFGLNAFLNCVAGPGDAQ